MNRRRRILGGVATALLVVACGQGGSASSSPSPGGVNKINHLIVIYQENWSFDSLFPNFPGASGIATAGATVNQVDKTGKMLDSLPQPIDTNLKPPAADARFPATLPVKPYDLSKYVPLDGKTGDIVHRYYQEQYQIDGGKMDKFAAWSDNPGLVLSYYDSNSLPLGKLAQQYVMNDNFFHSAFGGSFLNHFWLVCACTPTFPNAPASLVAQLDSKGVMAKDGAVTPDGFGVNTLQTVNTPHSATTPKDQLLPNQTMPTIGDNLTAKNVSWAWYSGGWTDALAGNADPLFQFHHQPFNYFQNYADGTAAKQRHLKDEKDFTAALSGGSLPAVSFVKPIGADNEHPGYAAEQRGQQHVADLVSQVQQSKYWNDTAIVITYDENGGRWDQAPPPKGDKWGPGTRVPAIIVSPYAKAHFVDHTQSETLSILKLIEKRWGVSAFNSRDAGASDLTSAFDFNQSPRKP